MRDWQGQSHVKGYCKYRVVFAPNSKHRARVTPAKRGRGAQHPTTGYPQEPTPAERRAAMTWAQRLKRVFAIDIEICPDCGVPFSGHSWLAEERLLLAALGDERPFSSNL